VQQWKNGVGKRSSSSCQMVVEICISHWICVYLDPLYYFLWLVFAAYALSLSVSLCHTYKNTHTHTHAHTHTNAHTLSHMHALTRGCFRWGVSRWGAGTNLRSPNGWKARAFRYWAATAQHWKNWLGKMNQSSSRTPHLYIHEYVYIYICVYLYVYIW